MRWVALFVALIATLAGFFFGIPLVFARGTALFDIIPSYFIPILTLIGFLLVYFRPRTASIFLILSALATSTWPFAIIKHLESSEQLSAQTISIRAMIVSIPSILSILAAYFAWRSHIHKQPKHRD